MEIVKSLPEVEQLELETFVRQTVRKYVEAECNFLDLVYEMGDQEDLSLEDTKDFIHYLGELRLYQMGYLSAGEVRENPLEWMDYILSGSTHTNFFESRVVDYSHSGLEGEVDYNVYNKILMET